MFGGVRQEKRFLDGKSRILKKTMKIEITDNSQLVKDEMQWAALRALEICGLTAEGYAKPLCPVVTGNLRNSITHLVQAEELAAYIGSNVEYAGYVELGTIKRKAKPYLKPSVADHTDKYRKIIEVELKG